MKFPSFFSRLYETEYALKNLFYSIDQHNNIELSQNPNQKIILAMFDVLELIFLYGKMLEIESINTDDLSDLKNEDSFQTLEHLISTDGNILFDTNDNHIIYVFSFKDKIIGGTSPLTLVYSSPNYEEKIHDLLSYETLKPLNERNKDFIAYLLYLRHNFLMPYLLAHYIDTFCSNLCALNEYANSVSFISNLRNIMDENGNTLRVNDIPLMYMVSEVQVADSDYMIVPTREIYDKDNRIPLLLPKYGMINFNYISNIRLQYNNPISIWNSNTIENRILPGTMLEYPYLLEEDFFENNIIRLQKWKDSPSCAFSMLRNNNEDCFLFPFKRTFLKFFTIENLSDFTRIETQDNGCLVRLTIPVKGGQIEIKHWYMDEDIIDMDSPLDFNLAVLPFYNTPKLPHHLITRNKKNILFAFFNSIENQIVQHKMICIEDGSYSYRTDEIWDIIVVEKDGIEGLLIPVFKEFGNNIHTKPRFSVNIEDTCTNIFESDDLSGNFAHFSMNKDYPIMESLYDSYYLRGANPFGFVLSNTLYDNNVRIPATISCLNHNINIPELFEGCNIKFEEQDYPFAYNYYNVLSYINSKPMVVQRYCEELLFLMMTKSLHSYASYSFNVDVIVPSWMSTQEKVRYKNIWNIAVSFINNNNVSISFVDSDANLLNAIKEKIIVGTSSFLDIDIDKYHTSFIYCDNNNVAKSITINYGLNDLMGDGNLLRNAPPNAYLRQIYNNVNILDNKNRECVLHVLDSSKDSTDKILILLDMELQKLFYNESYEKLEVLFICSLFSFARKFIDKYEIEVPKHILFSGLSKYFIFVDHCILNKIANVIFRNENVRYVDIIHNDVILFSKFHCDEIEKCNVLGISEERKQNIMYNDLSNSIEGEILDNMKHLFTDTDEICKIYGLSPLGYNNCWIDLMNESYQYYKYLALNANPINSECKAAIYFWPLKDSLYRIASTLYNRQ